MQKPDDLEGECPFSCAEETCPYGLTCRFFGTHREGVSVGSIHASRNSSEMNVFSKDVQKLLWKNKMRFPKADAKLKALGLLVWTDVIAYFSFSCSLALSHTMCYVLYLLLRLWCYIFQRDFT